MDLKAVGYESVGWIQLTHDTDQWRNLGNTITNRRVP